MIPLRVRTFAGTLSPDATAVLHRMVCEECGAVWVEDEAPQDPQPGRLWAIAHATAAPGHGEFREETTRFWTATETGNTGGGSGSGD